MLLHGNSLFTSGLKRLRIFSNNTVLIILITNEPIRKQYDALVEGGKSVPGGALRVDDSWRSICVLQK